MQVPLEGDHATRSCPRCHAEGRSGWATASSGPRASASPTPTDDDSPDAEGGADEHQGLAREGLLQGPGRLQGRQARGDQEGVPQDRPREPPRPAPRRQEGRGASRRPPRPTRCCPTPRSARSTTSSARCSAPGSASRAPAAPAPAASAASGPSMEDLFRNATSGDQDISDLFGGLFGGTPAGRRPTAARNPRRGTDIEGEVTIDFTQAVDGVTVPMQTISDAPCAACRGTGATAGTVPKVCPTCQGSGMKDDADRRRVRGRRAVPRLPGPRPRRRRPLPGLPRLGARPLDQHHAGPHPGRRDRRSEDPHQGQGRRRRERWCPGRPVRARARAAAQAVRPQGRQPHRRPFQSPTPRRRSVPTSRCPLWVDPSGSSLRDSGGHPERAHVPRAWQAECRRRTGRRQTCWSASRSRFRRR